MWKPRRCCAPGSSAIARSACPILQPGERLGLYGFGASAHLCIQVARHWGCEVYAFTRSEEHQRHARELGAAWAGSAQDEPPKQGGSGDHLRPGGRDCAAGARSRAQGRDAVHQRHSDERHPADALSQTVGRAHDPQRRQRHPAGRRGIHAAAPPKSRSTAKPRRSIWTTPITSCNWSSAAKSPGRRYYRFSCSAGAGRSCSIRSAVSSIDW